MKKISIFIAGFITALSLTAVAAGTYFNDESKFSDWNRDAINNMSDLGIITGYSNGNFGPNDYVTRAQLAVILDRFMGKGVEDGIENYVEKQQQANQPSVPNPVERIDVSIDDDSVRGDRNALITIVEFSDFECPFCGRFYEQTYPDIKSKYIDTGKVKYVFRDFPLAFHKDAKNAAMASECAGDQGDNKYWEYHDLLFDNQKALDIDNLKQYAKDLNLNTYNFNECLDGEKFADEVEKDMKDGQSYGVNGTPAFFINGRLLSGAQPFSAFETVIEDELGK